MQVERGTFHALYSYFTPIISHFTKINIYIFISIRLIESKEKEKKYKLLESWKEATVNA